MAAPAEAEKKTEETKAEEPKVEEKKAPEPPKELEEDQKKDTNPKIKDPATFLTPETTLNVLQSTVPGVLTCLSEGGLSHFTAGARASVGVKAGRHMFEAKIIEGAIQKGGSIRFGFATSEASLILGEDEQGIGFDSEGFMKSNKKRTNGTGGFKGDQVVAVVLNLDASSPNANTISLFRDGKRVCQPQPLPEELKGKTLFPAVSFKNATVHVNFGPAAVPLPFTCKTINEAAQKEAHVTKHDVPKDGKYDVLFPISLPDEATFDWLDEFKAKHPEYTELSDRAFADWGVKSGLSTQKRIANDRILLDGIQDLNKCKHLLMDIAVMQPRNFVVMEIRNNLIKEEREKTLQRFKSGSFKTTADVVMGTPSAGFKKIVQAKTLKAKQENADREHNAKYLALKREWQTKINAKKAERTKKKALKEAKKKAAATAAKLEADKKKADKAAEKKKKAEEAKAKGEEPPAEEEEQEEEPAPVEEEEEPESDLEPEPEKGEPEKVTLTKEEQDVKFFKGPLPDMTTKNLALSFTKFTLPEAGEFDNVKYSWGKDKECADYIKKWVLEKKQVTRVEDITPGDWFKAKKVALDKEFSKFNHQQKEYRIMLKKAADAKKAKADKKAAAERKAKAEAEKKKREAEKKAKEEAEKKAKAAEEGKEEEKKDEEKKEEEEEKKEEEPAKEVEEEPDAPEPWLDVDFEAVDVFGVEDIADVSDDGCKVPLVRDFAYADFALAQLRGELNMLVHAFSKDVNDEDRKGIPLEHLKFYYSKYFNKELDFKAFGVEKAEDLIALVGDSIHVKDNNMEALIPAEFESSVVFVKIAEAARRNRLLHIDMGEESYKINIKNPNAAAVGGFGVKRTWDQANGKGKDAGKGAAKGPVAAKGAAPAKGAGKMVKGPVAAQVPKGKGKDFGGKGKDFGGKGKDGGKGFKDGGKGFGKTFAKGFGKKGGKK